MIAFCKERGIVITAYAPFGRPGGNVFYMRHDVPPLLQDAKLQEIASKHGKSTAQVTLRYLVRNSNKSLCGAYGEKGILNAPTSLSLEPRHSQLDLPLRVWRSWVLMNEYLYLLDIDSWY
jgi:diketogulonate reductase-like aldo/keto reductase